MKKVLIVEDDRFLRSLYQRKIKESGFDVILASTGMEGLEQAMTQSPDIILLDFNLPELDGMGVLRELKHNPRTNKIPVIFLTNIADEEKIKKILAEGAQDYLIKSHNLPDEVIEKIKSFV